MRYAILFPLALAACTAASPPRATNPTAPAAEPATASVVVTPEMGSPHPGDLAPDFALRDQDGKTVRLSSLRGSVVVLAFVASFCPFSAAAHPSLARLTDELAPRGVHVIAVDVAEPEDGYRSYIDGQRTPFPVLRDDDGRVGLSFVPDGAIPGMKNRKLVVVTSHLVIDRDGRIRFFTLLDTAHFDAGLVHLRDAVNATLGS
jgi:peroxiredoxin